MKNILLLFLILLLGNNMFAQQAHIKSYGSGNYIFCGKELPVGFSYIISRKTTAEQIFTPIAKLLKPTNAQTVHAMLLSLPTSVASITNIQAMQVDRNFQRITKAMVIDSLYSNAFDARWQYVAGCGWFDDGLKPDTYQYKIEKLVDGNATLLQEITHQYPSLPYNAIAQPVRFKTNDDGTEIHYAISDSLQTAGLKIYRSKYLENNYQEKEVSIMYIVINNATVAVVNDNNINKGVAYSYVAVPYDALGNTVQATDTLHIIHQPTTKNIGLFTKFSVQANTAGKGNLLTWVYNANTSVGSIDVYRASSYNDNYVKIASVNSTDTVYTDMADLQAATTYYYYVVANTTYGKSFPSARTPAVIQGNRVNLLPPQNITANRNGNIATIQFENTETDTHGFYIYRSNGYTGELKQIGYLQHNKSNITNTINFYDTLPFSVNPVIYTYAVADVNTSYNISTPSDRVAIHTSGEMPAVTAVNASYLNKKVYLSWKSVHTINPAVSYYQVYKAASSDNNLFDKEILVATVSYQQNSFVDTLLEEGKMYLYTIKAVGLQPTDIGVASLPVQVKIPSANVVIPAQFMAFNSNGIANLKWWMPQEVNYTAIQVFKAVSGKPAKLIKELVGTATSFEDTDVEKGNTYYYYLAFVQNKVSNSTDTVAVTIK